MRRAWAPLPALVGLSQVLANPCALAADAVTPASQSSSTAHFGADGEAVDSERAVLVYRRALALYDEGKLEAALEGMRESYRLSRRAELLYNVARIEDEVGDCASALMSYRQYLDRVPDGRYRDPAAQATERLVAHCPEPTAGAPRTAVPSAAAASATRMPAQRVIEAPKAGTDGLTSTRSSTARWVGWSAIGAGALAGVGAVYFTTAAGDAARLAASNPRACSPQCGFRRCA